MRLRLLPGAWSNQYLTTTFHPTQFKVHQSVLMKYKLWLCQTVFNIHSELRELGLKAALDTHPLGEESSSFLHAGLRDNGKRDKGGEEEEHNRISSPGHSDRLLRPGWRVIHLGPAGRLNTPLYWMIQRFRMVADWPPSSCIEVWTCLKKKSRALA